MKTSSSTSNIIPALIEFQKDNKGIQKDGQGYNYKYISLDQIFALVRPALSKIDIVMSQDVGNLIVGDKTYTTCETTLYHKSGEWISTGALIVEPISNAKMSTMQNLGSAITYAKRYQLTAILGLSADVDDDAAIVNENLQNWGQKISPAQTKTLFDLMKKKGIGKEQMQTIMAEEIHTTKSSSQLTADEASKLISHLNSMPDTGTQV